MTPRAELAGKLRRTAPWLALVMLGGWMIVENVVLLVVLGARLNWTPALTTAQGLLKIVEVLALTVGPRLLGGALVAVAAMLLLFAASGRNRVKEARHA